MKQGFQHSLNQWYSTGSGRAVLAQEKVLVESAIQNLFGYFIVQLGVPSSEHLIASSRIKYKLLIDPILEHESTEAHKDPHCHLIRADLDYLPIGKEKADVVLLPHTLEVAADPYYLLRQVDSMLVPEGHVIITGFNPYGCFIMRHRWFKRDRVFEQAKLETSQRIKEWLQVLGYDVQIQNYSSVTCFVRRPSVGVLITLVEWFERVLSGLGLQFGNVYCLVAKKRVDSPTLVGSKWHMPSWMAIPSRGVVSATRANSESVRDNSKR
ncbi:MAG: methyltransferase domain-containing protein [Thiomicrorhabdus sp.]|jgi:hypothetical protein|nr:methyltransferase domain-containing protein [Thiomicrorhabdus sp.]